MFLRGKKYKIKNKVKIKCSFLFSNSSVVGITVEFEDTLFGMLLWALRKVMITLSQTEREKEIARVVERTIHS